MKQRTKVFQGKIRNRFRAAFLLLVFLVPLAAGFFTTEKVDAASWTSDYYFYVSIANGPEETATKMSRLKVYVKGDLGKPWDYDHYQRSGVSNKYTAQVRAELVDARDNRITNNAANNPYGLSLANANDEATSGDITVKMGLDNSKDANGEKKDGAGNKVAKGSYYNILVDIPFVYNQPEWEILDSTNHSDKQVGYRFNPHEYNWWNGAPENGTWAESNTIEKNAVSSVDQTCHFTMQVNLMNTGFYEVEDDDPHAKYELIMTKPKLNITYDVNGGSWSDESATEKKSGGTVTYNEEHKTWAASKVSRIGYHLVANKQWKTGSDEYTASEKYAANELKDIEDTYKLSAAVTLKANWEKNTCTVHYNGNGADGGGTQDSDHVYKDGTTFSANGFTRTGYTFTGWNTERDGSGDTFKVTDKVTGTGWMDNATGFRKTVYAQWKAVPVKYEVYLHANSPIDQIASWKVSNTWKPGNGAAVNAATTYNAPNFSFIHKTYDASKSYSLPKSAGNIKIDEYACLANGWYTEASGGDYIANGTVSAADLARYIGPDGAVHLYARWAGNYELYCHANSPTGVVDKWWIGENWILNNSGTKAPEGGITYTALPGDSYIHRTIKGTTEYTVPNAANSVVSGYYHTETGWWTADGVYVPNEKKTGAALAVYANDNNEIHLYAHWTGTSHTLTFDANGGNVGTPSVTLTYGSSNYSDVSWNQPTRENHTFLGWYTSASGGTQVYSANGYCTNEGTYWSGNICVYDGDYTVYAHWKRNTYTVKFDGNEATGGSMSEQTYDYGVEYYLPQNAFSKTGHTFTGWNTKADGTGDGYGDKEKVKDLGDVTLFAQWRVNYYDVTLHAGNGIVSVSGGGRYAYGSTVHISATVKDGYHWLNWTGTCNVPDQNYSFQMPANGVDLTANGEANRYTIVFHPNDGAEVTHINSIDTSYDQNVTLPNGADAYVKYTLDGVNVTSEVLSGSIRLSALELEEEESETDLETEASLEDGTEDGQNESEMTGTRKEPEDAELAGTAEQSTDDIETVADMEEMRAAERQVDAAENQEESPDGETEMAAQSNRTDVMEAGMEIDQEEELKTVSTPSAGGVSRPYPSVFMGWSLEAGKDSFVPQWKAGETLAASVLAEAAGVVLQDGATITLYANWDDCPWIQAVDLYYTLEQAQSGYITQNEILSHATASDREDGTPILPGFHDNGTSFSIPDYSPTDFTQFQQDGSCTENLTVVDSVGSTYEKQITVYIVDTTPTAVKPEGTTRFISREYYNAAYEEGGLAENSVWKTNPEYQVALLRAFDNIENDRPIMTFVFSREVLLEMKEYVKEHGVGNSKEPGALQGFYNQFLAPNRR